MKYELVLQGLILYACFIPVLAFHEFAHAWTAWKCGDSTAKSLGRVSLNPIRHMEFFGTVVLPLVAISLQMVASPLAGFIIGWGKPVPVNPDNLRRPRIDDTLVALAGPASNILLAFIIMGFAKLGLLMRSELLIDTALLFVRINLILAFFNLIPIPPLDGSHVIKNLVNMSLETYWRLAQYGIFAVILFLNVPGVRTGLARVTYQAEVWIGRAYGIGDESPSKRFHREQRPRRLNHAV
jgi:Zn-dependent protease